MGKKRNYIFPLALILSFFILWQILSSTGTINPALFSSPTEVLELFMEKFITPVISSPGELVNILLGKQSPELKAINHLTSTLYRLTISFAIAAIAGVMLGVFMGARQYAYKFFDPLITFFMPIPGIAWAPLFIMWIGLGDPNILAVGALACFFPIVYNTATGVRKMGENPLKAARIMGASKRKKFMDVVIPGSFPHIMTGLKLGLARGWRTIIAVEMIAATTYGIGYMIIDASDYLLMSTIYAGIIAIAGIYFIMEYGFKLIEKRTIEKWGMVSE